MELDEKMMEILRRASPNKMAYDICNVQNYGVPMGAIFQAPANTLKIGMRDHPHLSIEDLVNQGYV